MATEAELRRRISELQSQIESLRFKNESLRTDMTRQINKKFSNIRTEYESALNKQKAETEEMYAARIRSFQERIVKDMQQQYKVLEKESARIIKIQTEKLKELSDCNETLRITLQRIKADTELIDENHKLYAIDLLEQVKNHRRLAEETPHEFFFRGEFDIIDSHVEQIKDEIRNGMFQSAAADASSIIMEFDLLKVKVDQAFCEWKMAFQDYSRTIKLLVNKLNILEQHPLETVAGKFQMTPQEIDFWSSGTYLTYKNKVIEAFNFINEIENVGIEKYLKYQKKNNRKGIFKKVIEAQRWDDELNGITNCVLSERILSDERWVLARNVAKYLEKVGYKLSSSQFRVADEALKSKSWYPRGKKFNQNPMDCYDLVETIQGLDSLHITFVPVRQNGIAIRNECIVSMNAKTLQDPALGNEVIEINVQRIRHCTQRGFVLGIPVGNKQKDVIVSEENRRKKEPNPEQQIRYLEKKYH